MSADKKHYDTEAKSARQRLNAALTEHGITVKDNRATLNESSVWVDVGFTYAYGYSGNITGMKIKASFACRRAHSWKGKNAGDFNYAKITDAVVADLTSQNSAKASRRAYEDEQTRLKNLADQELPNSLHEFSRVRNADGTYAVSVNRLNCDLATAKQIYALVAMSVEGKR